MENIQQMSMLDVAIKLMTEKRTQQPINKIIKETLEMKGIDDPDGDYATQLYTDITVSSCFVYMGNDEWDLKSRQSLEEWDNAVSSYNLLAEEDDDDTAVVEHELATSLDESDSYDYNVDDEDDEDNDVIYDEDDYEDDDYDDYDDDYEDSYMDEDSYNDIMDDYEDMYED